MPHESDFEKLVRENQLPLHSDGSAVPVSPGFYMLFDDSGRFIYVGKAKDLHDLLPKHYLPSEQNSLIKSSIRFAAWFPTNSVIEAEIGEGRIYDYWVLKTGAKPLANHIRPPRATVNDQDAAKNALIKLLGLKY